MPLPDTHLTLTSTVRENQTVLIALDHSPLPQLKPGQILVRIEASPINPSDLAGLLARSDVSQATSSHAPSGLPAVEAPIPDGAFAGMAARVGHPLPSGNEAAGVVVAPEDSPLLGKTVGLSDGAMYAQYRAVDADKVLVLPEGVSSKDAASWFINPLTALGMVEYMRLDGHKGIVMTAAASQLGQMLTKLCVQQEIPLVNIVRRDEHIKLLQGLGAKWVLNSKSETFDQDLAVAISETNATVAYDATGGGTLAAQILSAMEVGAKLSGAEASWYGTDVFKQVYVYGGLDAKNPLTFSPSWMTAGFNWALGGFLLWNVLKRVGPERTKELYQIVGEGIMTTFKTTYTCEVSLEEMLEPDTLRAYAAMTTGEKYVLNPNK